MGDRLLQHRHGHGSRTEQGCVLLVPQEDDGGFQPYLAGAAVEDGGDPAVEVVVDVIGGGGAGTAGEIRRGCGKGHPRRFEEGAGNLVGGIAHRYGRKSGGYG